jgi:hypothetical protein
MAYVKLTVDGKNFIKKACGTGTSKIIGKNKYVLPYCSPETSPSKTWEAKAMHKGILIMNNEQLAEALIDWYDTYGMEYQMDANVLAAQAFQESGYVIWNYAKTSTASGISQFISGTVFDVILNSSKFTPAEKAALTKGLSGNLLSLATFKVSELIGRQNRPILHQNIIDNPEIMIKAQYVYMKQIANKNSLTSNALFGYNRGPGYIRPAYSDSIAAAASKGDGYENEGIDYVYQIFNILGNRENSRLYGYYFGYDFLGMNNTFNNFEADIAESNNRGHT